ncbi:23S rRNA (guanosine(2251)-2'-O)-methyltransferase RlmB [Clostridium paridis]|uniref:23S rRNA (Guanosine(2251)-2'-O)-methyltransferase RlmB n=1 Tax=Clostridium paridis TaxID=2803863 RepID=A0A937K1B3_9CLOT|nr:23S rRNA (guanosine(2251)-2'-O)-methyltransferase RlmB [Clostridium paridis]MBL4930266.1 23S rRNA (guanosine(2251)-2'-O)-methyltransferase RlmB [Clostridium paridis]
MKKRFEEKRNDTKRNDTKRNEEKRSEDRRFDRNSDKDEQKPIREDLVEGRNAVIEVLKSDRTIEYIMVAKGDVEGSIKQIIKLAKDKRIVIKEVDRKKLDSMTETGVHQGVMAIVTPFKYCTIDEILKVSEDRNEKPFIVVLDEIEDPHNLGSIIRTAELSGVHGIIIPKRRNVGVTPTVYKSSAGAVQYMKIAKVTNINVAIDELKEKGLWVYGADIDGEEYSYSEDFSGACAIVIGSEGKGISNLTLKKCDKLVKIPMVGKINSLNASVAGGIMMYEVLKSRIIKK